MTLQQLIDKALNTSLDPMIEFMGWWFLLGLAALTWGIWTGWREHKARNRN